MGAEAIVLVVVVTALVFDFTNGFHDSANAMATSVTTGAFKPKQAVLLAALMNLIGACLSTEVAKTISSGMVDDTLVTPETVFAALVGAIIWNLLTWLLGLPSSSSHAIFGALIGAVLMQAGLAGVRFDVVVSKILLPALVAPLVAGLASYLATKIAYHDSDSASKATKKRFRNAQRFSSLMVALAHGTSDGQKTMGIITLVLVAGSMDYTEKHAGQTPWWFAAPDHAPHWWVIIIAALAIAAGTYSGGWRIMRTMGKGMADIESPQGFVAETASMAAILASSHLGFGLSTTHVVSGAVMGTGLGRTPDEVRWATAGRMLVGWLLTLPAAALVGALATWLAHKGAWGFATVLVVLVLVAIGVKVMASKNHISAENVTESHEVTVFTKTAAVAKAAVARESSPIPSPVMPQLPDKIAGNPAANTPLRVVRLKDKKRWRLPPEQLRSAQEDETTNSKRGASEADKVLASADAEVPR
jgi:PiT family inorganic phosphate transporter